MKGKGGGKSRAQIEMMGEKKRVVLCGTVGYSVSTIGAYVRACVRAFLGVLYV